MGNSHGGKREGSGRKPNSNGITQSVKNLFTGEAEKAAQNIINISRNNDHPQQLKALEIILARISALSPFSSIQVTNTFSLLR